MILVAKTENLDSDWLAQIISPKMKSRRHRYRLMILGLVLCDILDHTLHCHIDFNHQKGSKTLASGECGAELDHSCPRAVVIRVKQYGHLAHGIMFAVQL